jgi:cytochrome c556
MPLSFLLTVVTNGMAFAHGTELHEKSVSADVQMQKLHAMMPMFSVTSAALESAIEKKDSTAVHTEIKKILTAIPDLKKSKPHKNVKQKKKFIELATNLETALNATASKANNNDFAGAMSSFRKVEETCATCHAKFRD